jgi:hypothetical protein
MVMHDLALLDRDVPAVMAGLHARGPGRRCARSAPRRRDGDPQPLVDGDAGLFYMHFRGNGDPINLAEALKAALDQTNSRR